MWWRGLYGRHQGKILLLSSLLSSAVVALLVIWTDELLRAPVQPLTQAKLEAAVNDVLDSRHPPSVAAVAYANVIGAVVRVTGYDPAARAPKDDGRAIEGGLHQEDVAVGTGVVVDEKGTILTNFHVASAAPKMHITFADGTEAEGTLIGAQVENDLAVIRPSIVPDDLKPATLTASTILHAGDEVVAIGFPFGIGPSATSGIVSGLGRTFEEEGRARIFHLIQFDAAANPGNSGGPLVNADGEVVGIVTAIYNPTGVRTFAGIGFAVPIETAAAAAGENPL